MRETVKKTFDLAKARAKVKVDKKPITLWLPLDRTEKYLRIQEKTGRSDASLASYLSDLCCEVIDGIDEDAETLE